VISKENLLKMMAALMEKISTVLIIWNKGEMTNIPAYVDRAETSTMQKI
jgi:hypothetical protein